MKDRKAKGQADEVGVPGYVKNHDRIGGAPFPLW